MIECLRMVSLRGTNMRITKFIVYVLLVLAVALAIAGTESARAGVPVTIPTPRTFYNQDNEVWDALISYLDAGSISKLTLNVEGTGGDIAEGVLVMRSIINAQNAGTDVRINVVGHAASMHAVLTCAVPVSHVRIAPGVTLMFHRPFSIVVSPYGVATKNFDLDYLGQRNSNEMFDDCVTSGMLTSSDLDKIMSGYKLYINSQFQKRFEKEM